MRKSLTHLGLLFLCATSTRAQIRTSPPAIPTENARWLDSAKRPPKPIAVNAPRKRFLLLSGAAYAAAAWDMHETKGLADKCDRWLYYCKDGRFQDDDPLARPFVHLPAPAYYASGFALATGVNWLGWKLGKSRRWHRIWWLPQVLSIGANAQGARSFYH